MDKEAGHVLVWLRKIKSLEYSMKRIQNLEEI
jgi:hypothetical protein